YCFLYLLRLFYLFFHFLLLHSFPTRRSSDLFMDQSGRDTRHVGAVPLEVLGAQFRPVRVVAFQHLARQERVIGLHARIDNRDDRSEEHTSELQSREKLVCRLLLEKKNNIVRLSRTCIISKMETRITSTTQPLICYYLKVSMKLQKTMMYNKLYIVIYY